MHIALLPFDIVWENADQNRRILSEQIGNYPHKVDIWVLPEMFNTGFSMRPEQFAETMEGATVQWMKDTAAALGAAITGSLAIKEGGVFLNRMLFVHPDGHIDWYDKRHLFAYSGEDGAYHAGAERKIVEYRGWRILLQVCYDLRFPVFARNRNDYDLIILVANWPATRIHHWDALLLARAIENQSYVAAVNRIGMDGNRLEYSGSSQVVGYDGRIIIQTESSAGPFGADLDLDAMTRYRNDLPFLRDADAFSLG